MRHLEYTKLKHEARLAKYRERAATREPELPELEIEGRRPTVTRVGTGLLLGGIPGALLGFAFRKKTKQRIRFKP
jgi:hypothetical protein